MSDISIHGAKDTRSEISGKRRCCIKKWIILVVGILVVVLAVGAIKDLVIKTVVESAVEVVTGLKLKIGTFRVGVINTLIDIKNLHMFNSLDFKDRDMLNMPEIYIDYSLPAILKGKIHLKEARINVQEFVVVKNDKGKLNLDSLKVVQDNKTKSRPKDKKAAKAPAIQIDKLQLKIGKVVYKDYSSGSEPRVQEFNVNINEEYRNITNPYALVSLIVVKALVNTSIASLTNFDLSGLSNAVSDTLKSAEKITGQVTETVKETTKVVTEKAAETAKKTEEAVSKTKDALGSVLKNPFGEKK